MGNSKEPLKPQTDQSRALLLKKLAECAASNNPETAHGDADEALVEYINDHEITELYQSIPKWYA